MSIQERYVVREFEVQGNTSYMIVDAYYEVLGHKKTDCMICATKSRFNAELIAISLNSCQKSSQDAFQNPEVIKLAETAMAHVELRDDLARYLDFHKRYNFYKGVWIVENSDGSYKVQGQLDGKGWEIGEFISVKSAKLYIDEAM